MKNYRCREWGLILFSITFLTMSTAHTAAATEVTLRDQSVTVGEGAVSFDSFLRQGTQQQNTLPQIILAIQSLQGNVSYTNAYNTLSQSPDWGGIFEELKRRAALLVSVPIPESPMLSPVP